MSRVRKTPVPIKKTPVPRKSLGLVSGDLVEVLCRDRNMPCAYPGQVGKITKREKGFFVVVLKCGHIWFFSKDQLKKVGHEDQAALARQRLTIRFGGERDVNKPMRRRKVGKRKIKQY